MQECSHTLGWGRAPEGHALVKDSLAQRDNLGVAGAPEAIAAAHQRGQGIAVPAIRRARQAHNEARQLVTHIDRGCIPSCLACTAQTARMSVTKAVAQTSQPWQMPGASTRERPRT